LIRDSTEESMSAYAKVNEAVRLLAEADHEMEQQFGARFRPTADALAAAVRARAAVHTSERKQERTPSGRKGVPW
jgi:hypothetical protein